jgi:hypothetical protein
VNYALHISILSEEFVSHQSSIAARATSLHNQYIFAADAGQKFPTTICFVSFVAAGLAVFLK